MYNDNLLNEANKMVEHARKMTFKSTINENKELIVEETINESKGKSTQTGDGVVVKEKSGKIDVKMIEPSGRSVDIKKGDILKGLSSSLKTIPKVGDIVHVSFGGKGLYITRNWTEIGGHPTINESKELEEGKPKLTISTKDPKLKEIIKTLEDNNIDFTTSSSGIVIDASNKKNNKVIATIMELAKDYSLKTEESKELEEGISKKEIEKAIKEVEKGKAKSQVAQSLQTYKDRKEFDGSLKSAIKCLKQAEYEISESEELKEGVSWMDDEGKSTKPVKKGQKVVALQNFTSKEVADKDFLDLEDIDIKKGTKGKVVHIGSQGEIHIDWGKKKVTTDMFNAEFTDDVSLNESEELEEAKEQIRTHIPKGFVAYTGVKWADQQVKAYNDYQDKINQYVKAGKKIPEELLNGSHNLFVSISKKTLKDSMEEKEMVESKFLKQPVEKESLEEEKGIGESLLDELYEVELGEAKKGLAVMILFFNKDGGVQSQEDVSDDPKDAISIANRIMKKRSKIVGYTIHDKDENIIAKGGSKNESEIEEGKDDKQKTINAIDELIKLHKNNKFMTKEDLKYYLKNLEKMRENVLKKTESKFLKEEVDIKKIISDLINNSWSGSNESQLKSVQLTKGLAFSDEPAANKFMKKLDSITSGMDAKKYEGGGKATEAIKELISTSFGGSNESQAKAVQLMIGISTSDEDVSNSFMADLDKETSNLKPEEFTESQERKSPFLLS